MLWCDLIFNFANLLFIAPQRPPLKSHRATLSPSLLFSFCCFPSAAGWIHCPYFLSHGLEIGSLFSTIWSRRSGVSVVVAVGPALKFRDFLTPAKARLLHRHRQPSSKSASQSVSRSSSLPLCAPVRQAALHLRANSDSLITRWIPGPSPLLCFSLALFLPRLLMISTPVSQTFLFAFSLQRVCVSKVPLLRDAQALLFFKEKKQTNSTTRTKKCSSPKYAHYTLGICFAIPHLAVSSNFIHS